MEAVDVEPPGRPFPLFDRVLSSSAALGSPGSAEEERRPAMAAGWLSAPVERSWHAHHQPSRIPGNI
jgi:hypothetical protein